MAVTADGAPSGTLPLIMLIPPQPLHQGLMGYPMMTAHQKGPQTAQIGVADGRMFAQGAEWQVRFPRLFVFQVQGFMRPIFLPAVD